MAEPIPIHRTEDEAQRQAPVDVVLGGRSFALRPLTFAEVRSWKAQYAGWDAWAAGISAAADSVTATVDHAYDRTERMLEMLVAYDIEGVLGGPDAVAAIATPDEVEEAYAAVRRVALPFTRELSTNPDLAFLVTRIRMLEGLLAESLASPASSSASTQPSDPGSKSSAPSPRKRSS